MNPLRPFVKPTYRFKSVVEIDLELWWTQGIRGLLLDIDDTLTPKNSALIPEPIYNWLQAARQKGFQLYLVSNNRYPAHVERLSQRLDIPAIAKSGKPRPAPFRKALNELGLEPHQVVAVGDRVMTDIIGGALMKIPTCLVDPVTGRPGIGKRILYGIEKSMLRLAGL